jgi:hypothetical protein
MPEPDHTSLDALAGGDIDEADGRVLTSVAALFNTLDPVPPSLVERIQFGITLDALNAEIAELTRDRDLAGVRSGNAETQTVTFTSPSVSVMVSITALSIERARVDGWVSPGARASVQLRTKSGVAETTADDDGRFVFDDVPRGMGQFVVRAAAPTNVSQVVTPSIEF